MVFDTFYNNILRYFTQYELSQRNYMSYKFSFRLEII